MWSYFSRDPLSGFAYDFGEELTYITGKSLWRLFKGKKRATGDDCTLFVTEIKGLSSDKAELAKKCFRSFKTFRHPNLLGFTDGAETSEKLCIATEPVVPLSQYVMDNNVSTDEVTLGIQSLCTALEFLIQRCNLIHNNVHWNSVFVTKTGEWKLGGFEFILKLDSESFPTKLPELNIYDPPERSRSGANRKAPHATDSYGLACVLWEVYNGPLPRVQAIKQPGKIPELLHPTFASLNCLNPEKRVPPWTLAEQELLPGGCMNNILVKSNIFLNEIQIKNAEEKRYFFQSLHEKLDQFPKLYTMYKLLPILLETVSSNVSFGSIVLPSLMKIGEHLESAEYESQIVPVIVKLFSSPDRQTRMGLLMKIDCYIEHVRNSTVNNDIYPHIIQGFMDTNPTMREQTVKSMLFVAPKLNSKNLNDDLMRHFARIQAKDEQAGIRTNTTVCIGKLACYMDPATRQRVLPAACAKAMRDSFPPSRIAGIMAITANLKYFTVRDTASKCLPAICPLTVDPEKSVREQAFKAVTVLLKRLEAASADPEKIPELESDVNKTISHSKDIFKSFTGWVMSSWTSGSTKDAASDQSRPSKTSNDQNMSNGRVPMNTPAPNAAAPTISQSKPEAKPAPVTSGWSDDEEDLPEMSGEKSTPKDKSPVSKDVKSDQISGSGWDEKLSDDEPWEDFSSGPTSLDNLVKNTETDFFGGLQDFITSNSSRTSRGKSQQSSTCSTPQSTRSSSPRQTQPSLLESSRSKTTVPSKHKNAMKLGTGKSKPAKPEEPDDAALLSGASLSKTPAAQPTGKSEGGGWDAWSDW